MEGLKPGGDFETPSHEVTKATTHYRVLSRPKSDPYILHMLQRLLLTVVFIWKVQSTLVDLWLLKKEGLLYPCQLKAPRVAVFFFLSSFLG